MYLNVIVSSCGHSSLFSCSELKYYPDNITFVLLNTLMFLDFVPICTLSTLSSKPDKIFFASNHSMLKIVCQRCLDGTLFLADFWSASVHSFWANIAHNPLCPLFKTNKECKANVATWKCMNLKVKLRYCVASS